MRHLKPIAVALTLLAVAAWAGSKVIVYTQVTTAVQGAPTTKTAGVPTQHQDGTELKAVHITISNPDDAGAGDEIQGCILRAWKYTLQNVATDGGAGYAWSRYPRLDLYELAYDAGIEAATKYTHVGQGGMTISVPAGTLSSINIVPMGPGSRLAWDMDWCGAADAGSIGTNQAQMVTSGVYY